MLREEFIKLTDFTPTPDEYEKIETAYYDFDGDKEVFCRAWVRGEAQKTVDARAQRIEKLQDRIAEQAKKNAKREKELLAHIDDQCKEIRALREKNDELEEWTPCSGGTNLAQEKYSEMVINGSAITVGDAQEILAKEFGFTPHGIVIIESVETYEAGRSGRVRVSERYNRTPKYVSSDWNYIRFDAGRWRWEMINGQLIPYEV